MASLTFEKLNAGATSPWWNVFDIDYLNWNLVWRVTRSNRALAGSSVKSSTSTKYVQVRYNRKLYATHRIIWEMLNGPIPDGMEVDHRDLDKKNNNPDNLRLVTHSQNHCNRAVLGTSKTGVKGLTTHCTGKGSVYWEVAVKLRGKVHRKFFPHTDAGKLEAVVYLTQLRENLHGEFGRHA